jgi:carboxymethylenebutenolidase
MKDFDRLTRRHVTGLCAGLCAAALLFTAGCSGGGVTQEHVTITTPDGVADALLFTPPGDAPAPAVLVWPDIGGLRPAFGAIGRRLAGEGYVVLVPNAFYRSAALDGSTDPGPLDRDALRERFTEWRAAADDAAIIRDTKAYMVFLDARPEVDTQAKAGLVGYDVGGAHAFVAARALPQRFGAVAVYHPLGIATARPNSPHLFVGKTMAAYYVALARPDDAREPGDKDDLKAAFANAGLDATVEVLAGGHGFAVPDNPAYDETSAKTSWAAALALLHKALH